MTLPFRAHRRAFRSLSALALLPALLTGSMTLSALPSLALGQDDKPADASAKKDKKDDKVYTLARVFKAKEVDHYKLNVVTNVNNPQLGGNVDLVVTMTFRQTTKEVKDNGNAVIVSEFDSASVKVADMDNDISAFMPTITTTLDKQGSALDTKIEGGRPEFTQGPGASMFNNLNQQGFYPAKSIKVGDTWKIDVPAKDKNSPKTTGTATLVGTETVNGMQTLRIKSVTDTEANAGAQNAPDTTAVKAHSEAFTNVDIATGKMVKTTVATTTDGGPLGKTKADVLIMMVPGSDKAGKDDAKKTGDKAPQ